MGKFIEKPYEPQPQELYPPNIFLLPINENGYPF